MNRRLEEQQEATRGWLTRAGLWVLTFYAALLVPTLAFEKQLGLSGEAIKSLLAIFTALTGLNTMSFSYYFLRRRTR